MSEPVEQYGLSLVTGPALEPLSLAEVKLWCKVDVTDDDNLLAALIVAAREYVETASGKQLAAAVWKLSLDQFPWDWPWEFRLPRPPLLSVASIKYLDQNGSLQTLDPSVYSVDGETVPGRVRPAPSNRWPIPQWAVNAVQVTYSAGHVVASVALAIAAGVQDVTPGSMVGIKAGQVLTVDSGTSTAEQVSVTSITATTFRATFAASHLAGARVDNLPQSLRTAMLLLVAHWYEHREAVGPDNLSPLALAVDSLIGSQQSGVYA